MAPTCEPVVAERDFFEDVFDQSRTPLSLFPRDSCAAPRAQPYARDMAARRGASGKHQAYAAGRCTCRTRPHRHRTTSSTSARSLDAKASPRHGRRAAPPSSPALFPLLEPPRRNPSPSLPAPLTLAARGRASETPSRRSLSSAARLRRFRRTGAPLAAEGRPHEPQAAR